MSLKPDLARKHFDNFFRNTVHIGLPVIEFKGIKSKVKQGDELEIDLRAGVIKNLTSG